MKRSSRSSVMYCASRYPGVSRAQIIDETGLSRTHVYAVVDELLAAGELIETRRISAGRGRPTTLLEINRKGIRVGGVWLSGKSIEVGVAGSAGEVLAKRSLPYSGDYLGDLDSIAGALGVCAEQSGMSMQDMRGVGVVVAGLVHSDLGFIHRARHDSGFADVPVVKLLGERVGMPVFAETDIRAAAVADQWFNGKSERALYVTFGIGIGTAFVVGGEVFGAGQGAAPVLARVPLGPYGSLHIGTSDLTLLETLWPDADALHLPPQQFQDMLGQAMARVARRDHEAIAAVARIGEYMGLGISVGINMLGARKVYVGGTLIDSFPDMMMGMIRRHAIPHIDRLLLDVDIQPLPQVEEFQFKGAFGLVLFNGFRVLNKDINARLAIPCPSEDEAEAGAWTGLGV